MGKIKDKMSRILYKIRNPQYDEEEREFRKDLNFKRLLFLIPFIIAAAIFLLLSFK